jgi:hypothetical protein
MLEHYFHVLQSLQPAQLRLVSLAASSKLSHILEDGRRMRISFRSLSPGTFALESYGQLSPWISPHFSAFFFPLVSFILFFLPPFLFPCVLSFQTVKLGANQRSLCGIVDTSSGPWQLAAHQL